jgi:hypothetical protein
MSIDKNTKSMMNPYSAGENFGLSADYTMQDQKNMPTNYYGALAANQRTSVIEDLLSKQTKVGDQETFPKELGKVYNGKAGD